MKKRVLVTGASKGIGKAIALSLMDEDYSLIVHYNKDKVGAESVIKQLEEKNIEASILQFDNRDRENCKNTLEEDMANNGAYYGVIYNSGICKDNAFPALTDEDWDAVIDTNLNGFYNILKPIVMPMVRTRQPGRIITIASIAGLIGNRGQVNYSATKAGIIGATKALALELGKRQITVNCVAPGIIETDMTKDIMQHKELLDSIPLKRFGKPEDIAHMVKFLLSENASYITRQVFSINGGLI